MADSPRYFLTTAIDYPNSRPHIGTAFEKLGADVQARYRRMEGYEVFFLMGNDENTVKVSKRAAELGLDPKAYCDDMARQFQEVWRALDVSFDAFIQTSEAAPPRSLPEIHPKGLRQRLYLQGAVRGAVLRGLRGVQDRHRNPGGRRRLPHPQDAARQTQRAVLLLRAVEVPGPTARVLQREFRLHPAGKSAKRGRSTSSRPA